MTPLFTESFDSSSLSSRGWYDNTNLSITSQEAAPGSQGAVEFHFPVGATQPTSGGSIRHKFTDTDAVYMSYWVKYSSNWVGSGKTYHPHEIMLLTNKDGDWGNLAYTHLTTYIEQNALHPRIAIQDGQNIDLANLNANLVGVTEARSVAGCNGDSDGYGNGSCYDAGGGTYWNGKEWQPSGVNISAGSWHKVEAYVKLNSIVNGKGVTDGIMRYWLDGQQVMNYTDVMFRTGQNPDMKFNQFVIAPWIGDGSPIDQTFWMDDLTVATAPPDTSGGTTQPPAPTTVQPPANLRITSN